MDSIGGSTGGQVAAMQLPTQWAAGAAGYAQANAAQQASELATQQGNSAIQALMGQYNTTYQMMAPVSNASVTATDQLNYMLGNSALAPGAAPVAPTAPTLAGLESGITQSDINSYISQNSTLGPSGVFGYTGAGAVGNAGTADSAAANAFEAQNPNAQYSGGDQGQGLLNLSQQAGIQSAVRQQLAQQQLNDPNGTANAAYNLANTQYGQQNAAYNTANTLYNQYQAQGPATSSDIANIIQNQPGYQAQQSAGINAIQNAAGAQGGLNSSNLLSNLNTFGQGLAGQYYQNYLGNLSTEAGLGAQATQGLSNAAQNSGNQIASTLQGIGTTQANAALAAGQAQASSYLAPNQHIVGTSLGGGGSNGLGSLLGAGASLLGTSTQGTLLGGLL